MGSDELGGENDPNPPVLGIPPPDPPEPNDGMLMPPPLIGMVAAPLEGEKADAIWPSPPLSAAALPKSVCSG